MRVALGNWISDFRFWSWYWRHPRSDEIDRDDNDCLHPEWIDGLLLRAQSWLWKMHRGGPWS